MVSPPENAPLASDIAPSAPGKRMLGLSPPPHPDTTIVTTSNQPGVRIGIVSRVGATTRDEPQDGHRPLLVELQALVAAGSGQAQRQAEKKRNKQADPSAPADSDVEPAKPATGSPATGEPNPAGPGSEAQPTSNEAAVEPGPP